MAIKNHITRDDKIPILKKTLKKENTKPMKNTKKMQKL